MDVSVCKKILVIHLFLYICRSIGNVHGTGYQRCFQVSDRRSEWNKKRTHFLLGNSDHWHDGGKYFSNAVISRISARINVMIQNEIQADIFEKIIHTEWKELKDFRSGDLLNRLSNDAVQVASSVISWIPNSITKLVQFIGAFAIIFIMIRSWQELHFSVLRLR